MDPMLLHPPQPTTVCHQLKLFRQGNFKTLYDWMLAIPHQPTKDSPVAFATKTDLCPQAESLVNLDNYRAGHQQIQSALPIAQMSDHIKNLCQKLHPLPPDPSAK
jgi:hypothetical protein